MSTDNILREWYKIKKDISHLQSQEKDIKAEIHRIMTQKDVNQLNGPNFVCTRTVKTTRSIKKGSVPQDLWIEYSTSTRYPMLSLKKK